MKSSTKQNCRNIFIGGILLAIVCSGATCAPNRRTIGNCEIVNRPVTFKVTEPGRFVVTARCREGEQMLGGGYRIIPPLNRMRDYRSDTIPPFTVEASYPSSPEEWTVVVLNPYNSKLLKWMEGFKDKHEYDPVPGIEEFSYFDPEFLAKREASLVVDCYCFTKADPWFGMQVVQSEAVTVPYDEVTEITCDAPKGSVVTAGGFRTKPASDDWLYGQCYVPFVDASGVYAFRWLFSELLDYVVLDAYFLASAPKLDDEGIAVGWRVKQHVVPYGNPNNPLTTTTFALVATENLLPGKATSLSAIWRHDVNHATRDYKLREGGRLIDDVDGRAPCASDEFSTGGGYEVVGHNLPSEKYPTRPVLNWANRLHGIDSSFAHDSFEGWDIHGVDETEHSLTYEPNCLLSVFKGDPTVKTWNVSVKVPPILSVRIVSPTDGQCIFADPMSSNDEVPAIFDTRATLACKGAVRANLNWSLATYSPIPRQWKWVGSSGSPSSRPLSFPHGGIETYHLIVKATYYGETAWDSIFFNVGCTNRGPMIVGFPPTNAVPDVPYSYDVAAFDHTGGPLTFSLSEAPNGMTINGLGQITWTPTADQIGSHNVRVVVKDRLGIETVQRFAIIVRHADPVDHRKLTPRLR